MSQLHYYDGRFLLEHDGLNATMCPAENRLRPAENRLRGTFTGIQQFANPDSKTTRLSCAALRNGGR